MNSYTLTGNAKRLTPNAALYTENSKSPTIYWKEHMGYNKNAILNRKFTLDSPLD